MGCVNQGAVCDCEICVSGLACGWVGWSSDMLMHVLLGCWCPRTGGADKVLAGHAAASGISTGEGVCVAGTTGACTVSCLT